MIRLGLRRPLDLLPSTARLGDFRLDLLGSLRDGCGRLEEHSLQPTSNGRRGRVVPGLGRRRGHNGGDSSSSAISTPRGSTRRLLKAPCL